MVFAKLEKISVLKQNFLLNSRELKKILVCERFRVLAGKRLGYLSVCRETLLEPR